VLDLGQTVEVQLAKDEMYLQDCELRDYNLAPRIKMCFY
jgi:hypothetical protein